MEYSKDKKIIIDNTELVFSEILSCKNDGVISIEIKGIKIDITFKLDESDEAKTKIEVPSNKCLVITCFNYKKYLPEEQGLFNKRKVFNVGETEYYLQFSSSIFSTSSDVRRVVITMTKDIE
ncbi:TPA: hypothetical protein MFA46_005397 [Klebsiella pneumoniae]|nr:hypothetical protein [Klebsiella pneumoniae]HCF4814993.1 hypothetical protein [Pseudomonas aeruginosa]HBU7209244.1 hypothetical protein [Klebsiella pneumoniae]HBU7600582.1 hypothetical protein [Klebsiella pneumoniae]HBU8377996.1 hypothetical protein [Klebsiella pneumoniae]